MIKKINKKQSKKLLTRLSNKILHKVSYKMFKILQILIVMLMKFINHDLLSVNKIFQLFVRRNKKIKIIFI